MSMIKEFKEFVSRGNVVDLAVAVVIGAAFGKIITSVVDNLFNPVLAYVVQKPDLSSLVVTLPAAVSGQKEATIKYGAVLSDVINFLIVAVAIFLVVKLINSLKRKPAPVDKPTAVPDDVKLLTEIRDELRARRV